MHTPVITIALDGFSSSGKSTMAKVLAAESVMLISTAGQCTGQLPSIALRKD